jgi:hypothetical protein
MAAPPEKVPFRVRYGAGRWHRVRLAPEMTGADIKDAVAAVVRLAPGTFGLVNAEGDGTGFHAGLVGDWDVVPLPGQAPPAFSPPAIAPQGFAPQASAPPGYAPQGHAPQGYAPQGYAPPGYAPPGFVPQGYAPPGAAGAAAAAAYAHPAYPHAPAEPIRRGSGGPAPMDESATRPNSAGSYMSVEGGGGGGQKK